MTATAQPSTTATAIEAKTATAGGFSYDAMGPAAADAMAAAQRIQAHMLGTKVSILEIGSDLSAIKGKLEHGLFGKWVAAEFNMSERTAQRYMAVAERFEGKQHILKVLPVRVIYALAASSTPAGFTDMKLMEIENGTIPSEGEVALEFAAAKKDAAEPKPVKPKKAVKALSDAQAAEHAVAMIKKRLGAAFPKFMELVDQAGIHQFMLALDAAAAKGESA
jgi:hypothetical protein